MPEWLIITICIVVAFFFLANPEALFGLLTLAIFFGIAYGIIKAVTYEPPPEQKTSQIIYHQPAALLGGFSLPNSLLPL